MTVYTVFQTLDTISHENTEVFVCVGEEIKNVKMIIEHQCEKQNYDN